MLEDGAVGADGGGDGLAGVAGGVLEGEVVGFEAVAVDLGGFGEEGAAGGFGVEGVGDDDVVGGLADAEEGDVLVVLGDDDALVVGAGGDLDEDAAAGAGEGVMVERVLDGGEDGLLFAAGLFGAGMGGAGLDADVDVLGEGGSGEEKEGEQAASHGENGNSVVSATG